MEGTLLKKIKLDNGLTLEFIDVSRKVAGDRYQVALQTRVTVPVEARWFSDNDPGIPDLTDIIARVGSTVEFEQKKERVFVDAREKQAVLENLVSVAEDFGVRYIGHPEFPKKLILKEYNAKT